MSITLAGSGGWQFPSSFRKYFEMNRIFSVALVYCDKMSAIAFLGTKEEIKRQRIKFRDSELGRILKQMAIDFVAFSATVLFNYYGPRTKVVNFFDE